MPADRRIIVQLQAEGYRNPDLQGEHVPGAVTPIGVWATRRDVGQERKVASSGTRDETSRDWRIRWNSRIALSPTNLLKVEDAGRDLHNRQHGGSHRATRRAQPTPSVPGPARDTWIMKLWPFGNNLETRQESGYSDVLIAALVSRAQGKPLAIPSATAALEACSGTVGRAFAASEVAGPDSIIQALSPSIMEMIGRSLIRTGELVILIDTQAGRLRLIPAETHDVERRAMTLRRMGVQDYIRRGPSRTFTHDFVPAQSVLAFQSMLSDACNGPGGATGLLPGG